MSDVTLQSLSKQVADFALAIDSRVDSLEQHLTDRLGHMDRRFDGMDSRLDGIDGRLDGMDGRLADVDRRLERVEGKLDQLIRARARPGRVSRKR